ncbi:histone-lysine N-methyltransferase SETMAR-like [Euwallacea fornicatus]|uniref:histone-lysine N-methyltransferase SETMAR-like n=1 Tax=Euwallacea fornicatus TaxID=995702 RepID=UPI00338F206B
MSCVVHTSNPQLTIDSKQQRTDSCEELLRRYETEGDTFLTRIVTREGFWVHYHQTKIERGSTEWLRKMMNRMEKISYPALGTREDNMSNGGTVTSVTHSELLKNSLNLAIKTKRRGSLNKGVLLEDDKAQPYTASTMAKIIQNLRSECLPHPDLAPRDSHVLSRLKAALGEKKFQTDDEVI